MKFSAVEATNVSWKLDDGTGTVTAKKYKFHFHKMFSISQRKKYGKCRK